MSARARHVFAAHSGELELELVADSLAELFAEAGRALAEAMAGAPPPPEGAAERVSLRARDREALLVAWLGELLFLADRDHKIYGDVTIERVSDEELVAMVRGGPASGPRTHVRAATFHDLRVVEDADGFAATVMLEV